MNTKLTLSIDEKVVQQAKAYAKENGTSVSELVEKLLKEKSKKRIKAEEIEITPLVKSMTGMVKYDGPDFDYKEMLADGLMEKYNKNR